ncbi:MAG: NUDIX domain-containing protein, partial [Candidatus Nanopelagicales bacterium]
MSLRSDVRAVLSAWTPPDNAQAALRDDYVAFVDAHDDAVSRACVPGHITASALVISPDRRRVLLTLHPNVGLWLQMGGHLEPGDAGLRAAAAREALEESGIPGL